MPSDTFPRQTANKMDPVPFAIPSSNLSMDMSKSSGVLDSVQTIQKKNTSDHLLHAKRIELSSGRNIRFSLKQIHVLDKPKTTYLRELKSARSPVLSQRLRCLCSMLYEAKNTRIPPGTRPDISLHNKWYHTVFQQKMIRRDTFNGKSNRAGVHGN